MGSSVTFSKSCMQTLTGKHKYKIMGYSDDKDLGNYIESKKFDVAGCEWTIRFFPGGYKLPDNTYVSLLVTLAASNKNEVNASFELTIMDQSGTKQHKALKTTRPYSLKCHSWAGFSRFMERSVLETSNYIKDDCLLIRCQIWVVRSITTQEASVDIQPSNIGQQFGQLLESGEGSDIRFEVGGETFDAHKIVLVARSPVFRAQLVGPMKNDDTKKCIEIVDMEAKVFKALLHFIYWDTLRDVDFLFAQHLLEAADRYGLERVMLICEAKLSEDVFIDNVATTLALADQKSVCFQFIAQQKNLKVVMQTDGFRHLQSSCPSLVTELMQYIDEHSVMGEKQINSKKLHLCWPWS